MKLERNVDNSGYTPPFAEKLDPSLQSEEILPFWRETMMSYHEKVLTVGKKLISLIALALDLDEGFFEKVGALQSPMAFLRLLHYPGQLPVSVNANYGASEHSDYGMITLLACDGVPGLQICREKDKEPRVWEDVQLLDRALVVNVGDMLERWTNCLFRSTLHRVLAIGQERYSIAFFLDPNSDCLVECLDSCCSETCPSRFPPIRSGDYLQERLRITYA
uniref:Putative iron/ascorbate oxidoreductase DDB_G0283291 n=1 Tax=Anthurium amnicola TaxID=1678845 RepID=A0A1D1YTT3_9ARAE